MGTPDTFNYMVAGYVVFWVVSFAFIFSLWLRTRGLAQQAQVLEQLLEDEQDEG